MFIGLSSSLTGSVSNIISFVPTSLSLFNSADRVKSILDLPRDDYSNAEEVERFGQEHAGKGIGVEARNVSFAYEGAENVFPRLNLMLILMRQLHLSDLQAKERQLC